MEELTVVQPELKVIDPKRTSPILAETEHKKADPVPGRKRGTRDKRWLFGALTVSLALNMMQWVVIYILQVGPI